MLNIVNAGRPNIKNNPKSQFRRILPPVLITKNDIETLIKHMKNGKARREDSVLGEMLEENSGTLCIN